MADDYDAGAKGNLLKALTMMDRLLSQYEPDDEVNDWTEHYNKSRLMLRNLEAKVKFLAEEKPDGFQDVEDVEGIDEDSWGSYWVEVKKAEIEFPDNEARRDKDDKLEYLASRLEALYGLLQKKNVYQIKAVETPDDTDPIGPDSEGED
jgi:hypothetical protein